MLSEQDRELLRSFIEWLQRVGPDKRVASVYEWTEDGIDEGIDDYEATRP